MRFAQQCRPDAAVLQSGKHRQRSDAQHGRGTPVLRDDLQPGEQHVPHEAALRLGHERQSGDERLRTAQARHQQVCLLYTSISPAEEVEADLRVVARYQPRARRVFLVGANPFVLSAGRLIRLADRIRDFLPKVRTIGMFARVSDILQKSAAELRELRARGITGISIGLSLIHISTRCVR